MQVLNSKQIEQKIKRLSFEIIEMNHSANEIILLGINNNGFQFAKKLSAQLKKITEQEIILSRIKINPASPTSSPVSIELETSKLKNKSVILVDDVANTGRTLFYACKPIMDVLPKKLEVAVLVDRKHKSFPIKVDYVGLSLATTIQENIDVQLSSIKDQAVILN